jgi:hypothetical protein
MLAPPAVHDQWYRDRRIFTWFHPDPEADSYPARHLLLWVDGEYLI